MSGLIQFRRGVAVTLLALVIMTPAPDTVAQVSLRNVTLNITVALRKPGGATWDVFGGDPDIAICVNSALGQRCVGAGTRIHTRPGQLSRGRCQDSFGCSFVVQVPRTGPFGLTVYDVDISRHDIIGQCTVNAGRQTVACGSARVDAL
jgi:hypothetical protein